MHCSYKNHWNHLQGWCSEVRFKLQKKLCETRLPELIMPLVVDSFSPQCSDTVGCVGWQEGHPACKTRSSADADNRLDAFSGQSRSTNMAPFHMLHIVSYCAIVTLSLRRAVFMIFVFKKFSDLEMGVKGHSRSLRVVSFDRLCMVSY